MGNADFFFFSSGIDVDDMSQLRKKKRHFALLLHVFDIGLPWKLVVHNET